MHDTAECRMPGQVFEQRSPRFSVLHLQGRMDDSSFFIRRTLSRRTCIARQHNRLVARRQLHGQFRRRAAAIRRQNPYSASLGYVLGQLRQNHAPIRNLGGVGSAQSQNLHAFETHAAEGLSPYVWPRQGVGGAAVVGEPPPAVQLSESHIQPILAAKVLECHEMSRRREKAPAVR